MRTGYRDITDPNDPYRPRVRRLHIYLWAKGTLAAGNGSVVTVSFLWLLISILGALFSFAWRGAVLVGVLFLIDAVAPGMVSCVFRETVGYELALSVFTSCSATDAANLPLISLAALLAMILVLIYPIGRFLRKIGEIVFMTVNIVTLGFPLKFIAYLASQEPTGVGKWFDKSHVFGPLSTTMSDIFPSDIKHDLDHLWEVYRRSQSPAYEQELDELLRELEARYIH